MSGGSAPGLDLARLAELRDLEPGETTYLDRAIGNFQVNSVAAVAAVTEAVAAGDRDRASAQAHRIAGSALNLGALRAGEAAQVVEIAARESGRRVDEALLTELDAAMAEARELLREYQAGYR